MFDHGSILQPSEPGHEHTSTADAAAKGIVGTRGTGERQEWAEALRSNRLGR